MNSKNGKAILSDDDEEDEDEDDLHKDINQNIPSVDGVGDTGLDPNDGGDEEAADSQDDNDNDDNNNNRNNRNEQESAKRRRTKRRAKAGDMDDDEDDEDEEDEDDDDDDDDDEEEDDGDQDIDGEDDDDDDLLSYDALDRVMTLTTKIVSMIQIYEKKKLNELKKNKNDNEDVNNDDNNEDEEEEEATDREKRIDDLIENYDRICEIFPKSDKILKYLRNSNVDISHENHYYLYKLFSFSEIYRRKFKYPRVQENYEEKSTNNSKTFEDYYSRLFANYSHYFTHPHNKNGRKRGM